MQKIKQNDIKVINIAFDNLEEYPILEKAVYENLEEYRNKKSISPKYISMWEDILKTKSLNEIRKMMLENNEEGNILRSTSIFFRLNESRTHSFSNN